MRILDADELRHVSGAGSFFVSEGEEGECLIGRRKGNNGYGNGGDDGVPGNSGETGGGKAEDIYR